MYDTAFAAGRTFDQFLESATENREMWLAMAARVRVDRDAAARMATVPGSWRLLALADDWCGDAINTLPVVAALADAVDGVELRITGRDEHPGLMERHLTGGSRSIPIIVLLDERGEARGSWGPRPAELQAWFEAEGRVLPKAERYRALRRWYARDRGASVAREIAELLVRHGTGRGELTGLVPAISTPSAEPGRP